MNRLTNLIHPKLKITAQAFHYAPPMPTHGTQPAKALYPFALQQWPRAVAHARPCAVRSIAEQKASTDGFNAQHAMGSG